MTSTFDRVKARLGCARLALNELPQEDRRRLCVGRLHANVTLQLLSVQEVTKMKLEEVMVLTEMTSKAGFNAEEETRILERLCSGETGSKRKKQQDCENGLNYLTEAEWEKIDLMKCPFHVAEVLVNILTARLKFYNPTEHTLKMIASASFAQTHTRAELLVVPTVCQGLVMDK